MSTFRHNIMVRFREDATNTQIAEFFDGLAAMPDQIDVIRNFQFGPDLGVREGSLDAALVADFDSEEDWRVYSEHPFHQRFIHEVFRPLVEEAVRVQYLVD